MNNTNNLLMIVAILAVAIALVNLGVTIKKIDNLKELTGHATDTGDVNVTIVNQAVVNFNTSNINWGSGAVNVSAQSATLNTEGTVTDGNWTNIDYSLSLQNDGNVNITVDLQANKNAASFIGGGAEVSPEFQIKVSNNESNSCAVAFTTWTTYGDINTTQTEACSNMGFDSSADLINIDVQIVIPSDATPTPKSAIITATGTSI